MSPTGITIPSKLNGKMNSAYNRAYNELFKEKRLAASRLYRQTHKHKRNAKPEYRNMIVALLLERDGNICGVCKLPIAPGTEHIDHILPVCCGGTEAANNVRLLHNVCNRRRERQSYGL